MFTFSKGATMKKPQVILAAALFSFSTTITMTGSAAASPKESLSHLNSESIAKSYAGLPKKGWKPIVTRLPKKGWKPIVAG
jgi:hypothetical protein